MRGVLMFCFGLIFTLNWVFIHGYPEPQLNGKGANAKKSVSGLIIGGQRAKPGDAPETVVIRWKALNGWKLCTGTIFHKHWVLTVAHCHYIDLNTTESFVVVAGDLHFTSLSKSRSVHSITLSVVHPRYWKEPKETKPGQAPIVNCRIRPGDKCRLGGWGYTSLTNEPVPEDDYLQWMETEIQLVKGNVVFFIDPQRKSINCDGDSGGGVICYGMLAVAVTGTSPAQNKSCDPKLRGVGPDILKERAWIEQVIGEKLPADKNTYCSVKQLSGAASHPSLPAKGPVWFSLLWSFIMFKHF